MGLSSNTFVFVVCGAAEHIHTLNYSLATLKRFTQNSIVVITDLSRNTEPIQHDNVVNVETPKELNHHQASIYLKTSINRLLPEGSLYCYLDTDVVALDERVNDIFNHYHAPITFAYDHCSMRKFSPSAVHCNCQAKHNPKIAAEEAAIKETVEQYSTREPEVVRKKERMITMLREAESNRLRYAFFSLRFNMAGNIFKLDNDLYYNKKRGFWFDATQRPILFDSEVTFQNFLDEEKGIIWETKYGRWNRKSHDIYELQGCDHLAEEIKRTFDIEVTDRTWTHWNGGVFLFDAQSHAFLDTWHQKTMTIFKDPRWKTRDQGTLIATVWKFGLQSHYTLNKDYNFIADKNNTALTISDDGNYISDDGLIHTYNPAFIHVFYHFGDKNWSIWQWIEKKLNLQ